MLSTIDKCCHFQNIFSFFLEQTNNNQKLKNCRKINFITYESGKDPSAKIRSKVKLLIHYFLRTPHKTVFERFF